MWKKILIVAVAIAALAGGTYYYLYHNTKIGSDVALADYTQPTTLEVVAGTVLTKLANESDYKLVDKTTTLAVGTTIKVLDDSSAVIHWFDDSLSRLDSNTELTITKMDLDPNNSTNFQINTKLDTGQMWNKVLNLVNPEAEFTVAAGDTVAGVRGSTLNISYRQEDVLIWSLEHAAFIRRQNIEENLLAGEKASVSGTGTINVTPLTDDDYNSDWAQQNATADAQYLQGLRSATDSRLQEIAGTLPDDPTYFMKKQKEQAEWESLTAAPDKINYLLNLAKRRLAESALLYQKNRADLAKIATDEFNQAIDQAKNLITTISDRPEQDKYTQQVQELLQLFDRLLGLYKVDNTNFSNLSLRLQDRLVEENPQDLALLTKQLLMKLYTIDDQFESGVLSREDALRQLLDVRQEIQTKNLQDSPAGKIANKLYHKLQNNQVRRRPRPNDETGGSNTSGSGSSGGGFTGGTTPPNDNGTPPPDGSDNPPPEETTQYVGVGESCNAEQHILCRDALKCENGTCVSPLVKQGGKCDSKLLCEKGLLCLGGLCSTKKTAGQKCETDQWCSDGLKCLSGVCNDPAALIKQIEGLVNSAPRPLTTQWFSSVMAKIRLVPDEYADRVAVVLQKLNNLRLNQINLLKSQLELIKNELEMLNKDVYTKEAKAKELMIKNLEDEIALLTAFSLSAR